MVKKNSYERVEITFSKNNEIEMEILEYLNQKSKLLGKGKYIKSLIYKDMKNEK